MQDNDGKIQGIVCVAQDVTERRRAEEQIREQASLLDKAQDAIYVRDLEHHIISGLTRLIIDNQPPHIECQSIWDIQFKNAYRCRN